jgi:hypothetical protein
MIRGQMSRLRCAPLDMTDRAGIFPNSYYVSGRLLSRADAKPRVLNLDEVATIRYDKDNTIVYKPLRNLASSPSAPQGLFVSLHWPGA